MARNLNGCNSRRDSRDHQEGHLALLFSLAFLPMLFCAGAAVDYGRALHARDGLRQATDAVGLALAKIALSQTATQLNAQAALMLAAVSPAHPASLVGEPMVSADRMKVCLETTTSLHTIFMKLAGIVNVQISASACATNGNGAVDIALARDVSVPHALSIFVPTLAPDELMRLNSSYLTK